ncbi:hypothetical protein CDO52_16595 [Nocardiopsis gilva YIM 90087]|uniref:Uncharacterized protein n=1 Tax=Nocardiopsis gilva YIM 90087 TaxID=1235441 RepID=A0A223S7Y1_9ACTN|nr:hypothetical protein CDO52_16595 [Nocardiopsis gilva YIM 90087]
MGTTGAVSAVREPSLDAVVAEGVAHYSFPCGRMAPSVGHRDITEQESLGRRLHIPGATSDRPFLGGDGISH